MSTCRRQSVTVQFPKPSEEEMFSQVFSEETAIFRATDLRLRMQRAPGADVLLSPQDLYVYISEHEHFTDFNVSSALFWQKRDLVYGDWTSGENADGCYEHYGEVDISQSVQQNGSIYVHVYFTKSGFHPDPRQKNLYRRLATVHTSRMINKYKRRRFQKTKNLLTGETEADPEMIKRAEDYGPVEVISHWHPNLTINMVDDHTPWVKGSVPPPLDQYVKFDAISGDYYPILYFNDYWNLQKDYFPINETLQRLPFRLSFCPLSLWRWQLYAAQSTKSPWNFLGEDLYEQSDEEQDSVKVALLETNPYLLALTIVVSIVHSIFEFLAFKNDIQFWNSRQSLEGLSVRSVFFGVFQSLVVLLYILDNETNFVVQVSVFIGLLIDLWKITKVMDVRLDRENKVAGVFPRVTFKDKSTYIESSTKVYDDMAFRYLSWILFPLLGCYAVYSLLYLEHKGWYSWVLSMLYGFLLTFGFITMTPQLFINYKLKSVAHLPWRMLTYKALNTFIDDLFAFVIKMPMMYRIGCLRDAPAVVTLCPQRGNPVLKFVRNVPWEFGDIVPDYVLGQSTCALFLSLRYHHLNPGYIHDRLRHLGRSYGLQLLLLQVDV
ncbi:PREDICTED: cleft lip and palate transmembrane protein 1, partial [Nipponia nippon]